MVGVFGRSVSMNLSRPSTSRPKMSHHTRSISLPCRPHPTISHLREATSELIQSWSATASSNHSSAWLTDGLARLRSLHDSLGDALNLPQTRDSLRRQTPEAIETLLDHFLRFADAYGIFRTLIISLKEEHSSASVAVRRRDEFAVAGYLRARRRLAKEMKTLALSVLGQSLVGHRETTVCVGDAEVMAAVGGVAQATAIVSVALFGAMSAFMGIAKKRVSMWERLIIRFKKVDNTDKEELGEMIRMGLRKKSDDDIRKASKMMRDLEECVVAVESSGEMVFRGLIAARVSLLNTFTR